MKKNPPNVWVRPHCVKKMLQVMRLALLFVVLFFTSASAFTQRVSLSVKRNDVERGAKQVKDQTGVRILYDAGKMKRVPCREMKITDLEIAEALKQILKDTRFEFFEEGGVFIVREVSLQQAKMIRLVGKVTDEKKPTVTGGDCSVERIFSWNSDERGRDVPIIHSECPGEVFFSFFLCRDGFPRDRLRRERHDRRGDEGGRGDVGRRGCHRLHDLGQE